jgi:putative ABC transport system substrate-binding protein
MRRRDVLALIGAALGNSPLAARGQQPGIPVVGVLSPNTLARNDAPLAAWRKALGEAGFVEGRTLNVEYRSAGTDLSRLPALAAELVERRVDAIWSPTLQAALAAKKATASIPVVFSYVVDPVGAGLVADLAGPGGNVTGVGSFEEGLAAKRLQLLHELVPAATRIGYLAADKDAPPRRGELQRLAAAGETLGVEVVFLTATTPEEIEPTLVAGKEMGIGAVVIQAHPVFGAEQKRLVELCARYALPAARLGLFAAEGGLISYTPDREDIAYLAGVYVARILKGEKPAELPVTRSSKQRLVINLKTAKALGLTVPQTLLARADEVIE